jgi:hypothetical protein
VVFGGFIAEAGVPGAYFNFGAAQITITKRAQTNPDNKTTIEELWLVKGADGSTFELAIEFPRGALSRSKVEAKLHSATKPEFYRIYKFEQAADLVRSTAMGVDRATKFSIKANGPRFAPIFDGTEQVISITSVPYYSRSIYVPAM